ncbi:hypothetical protein DFA_07221 [Cavenderia fasciculata]|uniref:Uncharacterized protein n=1 Tax=Cavenderia fasciculata TaxID=261658 RepID=F4PVU0_CACFS|nr:uncharacterized protein DFA_07221 [Cavenderia fasciculata]EGG20104.1 hypothetical protein DFA_07221 [Cavenderia fasciculata]|eukprot:XP_004367087.1 hypothetical protein DFA_07221 [Cavenderia fasciculata]
MAHGNNKKVIYYTSQSLFKQKAAVAALVN